MAHNHHNSTDSLAEKIKRHPKYYLSGGDIHFLVETYLFRVHRYFFERESAYFREKLAVAAPPGQSPKGSSDANPFPLEDVLANDFSRFLWVFYNPKYSIYDATVDDWSAILKLAFDWRFGEVKKLCCRELEKFEIAPMQKIELYQTYELDKKLLIPSYIAMCMRPQPLSIKEGRQLGLETALLIATAREHARGQSASDGTLSPSPVSVEDDDMVNMIKDVFGITAGPPSPSLTPLENTSSASAFTTPSKLTIPNGITSPPRPSLNTMTSLASASATAVNSVFGDGTSQAATVAPAQAAAKDTVKSPGHSGSVFSPLTLNNRLISVFQMQGSVPDPQVTPEKTLPETPVSPTPTGKMATGKTAPMVKTPVPKSLQEPQPEPNPPTQVQPQVRPTETAKEKRARLNAEKMAQKAAQKLPSTKPEQIPETNGQDPGRKGKAATRRVEQVAADKAVEVSQAYLAAKSDAHPMDDSTSTSGVHTPLVPESDASGLPDTHTDVAAHTPDQPDVSESANSALTTEPPQVSTNADTTLLSGTDGPKPIERADGDDQSSTQTNEEANGRKSSPSESVSNPPITNNTPENTNNVSTSTPEPTQSTAETGTAANAADAARKETQDQNDTRTGENVTDGEAGTADPRVDADGAAPLSGSGGSGGAPEAPTDSEPVAANGETGVAAANGDQQKQEDVNTNEHKRVDSADSTETWVVVASEGKGSGSRDETVSDTGKASGQTSNDTLSEGPAGQTKSSGSHPQPKLTGINTALSGPETKKSGTSGDPNGEISGIDPKIPAWDFGEAGDLK